MSENANQTVDVEVTDEQKVTFTTKVSEKIMLDYNKYIVGKNRILVIIMGAILIALGVMQIVVNGFSEFFGLFLTIMGAFFIVFFSCITLFIKRNIRKSDAIRNETVQTMTFHDGGMDLVEKGKFTNEATSSCAWERFIGAVETEKYFYLFVAKNQAMLIDKSGGSSYATSALHDYCVKIYGKRFKYPKKLYK